MDNHEEYTIIQKDIIKCARSKILFKNGNMCYN